MRKTELLKQSNKQKQQIEAQQKTIEDQKKTIEDQKKEVDSQCTVTENVLYIFKVLVEGGKLSVHIHPDKDPSYFVCPDEKKAGDIGICTRKIFEGLYSRGLLIVTNENVFEGFAVQTYALRISKEHRLPD